MLLDGAGMGEEIRVLVQARDIDVRGARSVDDRLRRRTLRVSCLVASSESR